MSSLSKDIENQCVLASIMPRLASSGAFKFEKPLNGAPVTYVNGNSDSFISGMFGNNSPAIKPYLNITPAELSLLVPKVQFFKMIYSDSEPRKFIRQMPIIFRDHVGADKLDAMFKSGKGRLGEVGLKSINIQQEGDHQDATNYYRANISLFADSIESFLNGHPEFSAPYHSLIAFSGPEYLNKDKVIKNKETGEKTSTDKIADPTYFEVKCVIGWSIPKDKASVIRKEVKKAIETSEIVLTLNLVSHNLSFNDDGTMTIDIEYLTSIEMLMDSFRGDMFNTANEMKYLRPGEGKVKSPAGTKTDDDQRRPSDSPKSAEKQDNKTPDRKEQEKEIDRSDILRLCELLEPELKFCPREDIQAWRLWRQGDKSIIGDAASNLIGNKPGAAIPVGAAQPNSSQIRDFVNERRKSKSASGDKLSQDSNESSVKEIPFLFFGSIVEAAMHMVQGPSKIPTSNYKYRLLCGPLTYMDRFTNQRISINLGQVPISLSQFNRFLNKLIVSSGKKRLTIMDFLKGLVEHLIKVSLGSECSSPSSNIMSNQVLMSQVDMALITHTSRSGEDVFKQIAAGDNVAQVEQLSTKFTDRVRMKTRKAEKDEDRMFNYIIIYASYMPVPYRDGDREKDEKQGIYHYFLGRDRGIVNVMNFSKISQEGRRTELMRSGGDIGAFLVERYDVQMTLQGFPQISAGQTIHINPAIASLGDSRSGKSFGAQLGLTGYYFIKKVDHKIDSDNQFMTTVHAVNMGLFDGEEKPINKLPAGSENKDKVPPGSRKPGDNPNEKGEGATADPASQSAQSSAPGSSASSQTGLVFAESILGSSNTPSVPINSSGSTIYGRSYPSPEEIHRALGDERSEPFPKQVTDSHKAATDFAREILMYLNSDQIGQDIYINDWDNIVVRHGLDEKVFPDFGFSYYSNGGLELQTQVQVNLTFNEIIDTRNLTFSGTYFGQSFENVEEAQGFEFFGTDVETRGVVSQEIRYVYECYKLETGEWVIWKFFED